MEYAIGVVLALAISGMATGIGWDRDRAFYPTVLTVVASYYVLFATMGASGRIVLVEALVGAVFVVTALVGSKTSLWLVAAALVGHGLFDLVHNLAISNPGMPRWWPGFCMAYDVVAGGYLAVLLSRSSRVSSRP